MLAGLFFGSFQPHYLRIFSLDRARLREFLSDRPYTKTPGLRQFLLAVRERTPPGSRIALFVPMQSWDGGYSYSYNRAVYLLAGREVIALIGPGDQPRFEQLGAADYVASWRASPPLRGYSPQWQSKDGVLLRRVK